jgi:hypothetical protein
MYSCDMPISLVSEINATLSAGRRMTCSKAPERFDSSTLNTGLDERIEISTLKMAMPAVRGVALDHLRP